MKQIELLAHFFVLFNIAAQLTFAHVSTIYEMPFNIFRRQVLIDLLKAKSSKNTKENPPRVSLILIFLKLAFGYENTNTEEVKKIFRSKNP